jgi:PE-PGRS C-terminal aspartyl peptidase-like domain
MAGRDGTKQARSAKARRRLLVGMGAGAGVFFAAAAMATSSAAPAKADFEDLLDPIIQPILTSLTDSIGAFDPAAALDLTSWTDSFLASLNSIDLAVPSAAEPAAAVAPAIDPTTGTYDIPMTLLEGTEPSVQASIDGGPDVPVLVDTGSAGLVIPYTDLGSTSTQALQNLFDLGFPTGISESGYSGGVEYVYLTYDNVPIDYGTADNLTTTGPVDVEIFSLPTSFSTPTELEELFTNTAFQDFLNSNDVSGILGVGENASGPTTSPLESYGGVELNVPGHELIVDPTNPGTGTATLSGAPISGDWVSVNGAPPSEIANDIDSGGVTGTIPSSLLATNEYNSTTDLVNPGTVISVYSSQAETNLLYSYTVTADNSPIVVSPGDTMDSGAEPFLQGPIYMDYSPSGTGTTIFDY